MTIEEIQEECKRRFPIGCEYDNFNSSKRGKVLKLDSTTYSIHGSSIYAHEMGGCLYQHGKYAELISLPDDYFVLPEKWCVNIIDDVITNKYLHEHCTHYEGYQTTWRTCKNSYFHSSQCISTKGCHSYQSVQDGYTEITFDQFLKYVVNKSTNPIVEDLSDLKILLENII